MALRKPARDDARGEQRPRALVVSRRGKFWVGEPLFERGPQIPLARGRAKPVAGQIALCRFSGSGRGAQPIADLGRSDSPRDVVAALVADRGLRPTFRDRHLQEAEREVRRVESDHSGRVDLIDEPTFTVDPASAHDFDDAVSARRDGDGFRVWVHIADVAAYVKPDGGLDAEALSRANSTYAPGTVSPMLPAILSNEACSLRPGVERFAVTAEMTISSDGEVGSASFQRSVIRSDARLDYDHLDRIFAGKDRPPEHIADALAVARDAARALGRKRSGSDLVVSGAEPEFVFDEAGDVAEARAVPETEAHRLIERLMIATNEQVAQLLERKGVPALYRVHEQPDPDRVGLLFEQLDSLDVPTPPFSDSAGPSEAGAAVIEASRLVAAEAKRRGHGAASLSSLLLRAMKPARYSPDNLGHAGLGSNAYAHFTSPIRRYPDLIAHRALLAAVDGSEPAPTIHEVDAAASHCSDRERESMKVERDGDDICAAFLLQRELLQRGQLTSFEGEVVGVIRAGAFIRFEGELSDVYEGFFPARRMPGERFELNEFESALRGLKTGTRVGIGDQVEVRVESIEAARGRVDLIGADHDGESTRRGRRGSR